MRAEKTKQNNTSNAAFRRYVGAIPCGRPNADNKQQPHLRSTTPKTFFEIA